MRQVPSQSASGATVAIPTTRNGNADPPKKALGARVSCRRTSPGLATGSWALDVSQNVSPDRALQTAGSWFLERPEKP